MLCKKCSREMPTDAAYCPYCGRAVNPSRAPKRRGNGQGTVFQRNGRWYAQVTKYISIDEDGKKHRKYATKGSFKLKKDALAYLETLRQADVREIPKLVDLYKIWSENDLPKLSRDKQSAYRKARERLEPIIGRRIDTLTTADLQAVVNAQADSFYTRRDMKTLLSHLYRKACVDQFVPVNLAQYIVLPELEEREAVPFSPNEVQTMWKAFADGDMFIGYLLTMIYSGAMPGEILACKKSQIDFDKCEIRRAGLKTNVRKQAPIVFASSVKPVLQALCALYDDDRLYPFHETKFYDEYHEATKRIGIRDLPPYSCRHTTGTEAAKLNLNASIIQKVMRHAKITTSQRYIHLGSEEAHNAVDQIK